MHCPLMSSSSRVINPLLNSSLDQGSSHYHHHGGDLSAQVVAKTEAFDVLRFGMGSDAARGVIS